jgi:hypothetical protein
MTCRIHEDLRNRCGFSSDRVLNVGLGLPRNTRKTVPVYRVPPRSVAVSARFQASPGDTVLDRSTFGRSRLASNRGKEGAS